MERYVFRPRSGASGQIQPTSLRVLSRSKRAQSAAGIQPVREREWHRHEARNQILHRHRPRCIHVVVHEARAGRSRANNAMRRFRQIAAVNFATRTPTRVGNSVVCPTRMARSIPTAAATPVSADIASDRVPPQRPPAGRFRTAASGGRSRRAWPSDDKRGGAFRWIVRRSEPQRRAGES